MGPTNPGRRRLRRLANRHARRPRQHPRDRVRPRRPCPERTRPRRTTHARWSDRTATRSTWPTAPAHRSGTSSSPAATTAPSRPTTAAGSRTATAGASPSIRKDGSVVVRRLDPHDRRRGSAVLPADYVGEHVDLGYAVTAHRAQGVTVDTCPRRRHRVHDPGEPLRLHDPRPRRQHRLRRPRPARRQPRHARGGRRHREDRAVRRPPALRRQPLRPPDDRGRVRTPTAASTGWPPSSRPSPPTHNATASSTCCSRSGLTATSTTSSVESTAFGPLTAALRRAEAYHHDLERLVPRIVSPAQTRRRRRHRRRPSLPTRQGRQHRLAAAASAPPDRRPDPRTVRRDERRGPPGDRRAQATHRVRARALAEEAIQAREPWTRRLGELPRGVYARERWLTDASTVAAYRDRYRITSDLPLGGTAANDAQRADRPPCPSRPP